MRDHLSISVLAYGTNSQKKYRTLQTFMSLKIRLPDCINIIMKNIYEWHYIGHIHLCI